MRGAHAALSPNFGAPAIPAPWHAMQLPWKFFLPSAAGEGATAAVVAGAAGAADGAGAAAAAAVAGAAVAGAAAFQPAPASFAMKTTARSTSASDRSVLPPFAGI